MSSIGGPGGIGGPKGPSDVDRPDAASEASEIDEAAAPDATAPGHFDQIAADIAAGKLSAQEAIERMVDEIAGHQELAAADRAELKELLGDLVANDPYLSGLIGRV
jgi:erythromycin esterase-like protein